MRHEDHTGKVIDGRYRLIDKVGEGGMGSVYLGQHAVIGKEVAVKLLRVELAGTKQIVERFYREAHAAAAIKHKNIIDIFDLGLAPWGEPYLVMEFLKGESLGTLLTRCGPVNLASACGIMEPILEALKAAHDSGVIHRDLKPENVFLKHNEGDTPTVKLIDFGISKFSHEDDQLRLTQTGTLLGTPAFLSPEQARGNNEVDHRSDIWAAGIILYECLTQTRPFTGDNYNDLIFNIMNETPKPPSAQNPNCPPEADSIVMRALEKYPENRYESGTQMLDELKKLDCWDERNEQLKECCEDISNVCFAAGDLGLNTTTVAVNMAATVLDQLSQEQTPKDWSLVEPRTENKLKGMFFVVFGLVSLIALCVAGAAFFFSYKGANQVIKPDVIVSSPPKPEYVRVDPLQAGIEIHLEGLPEGAKVYYQDSLVQMNPFRVDQKATLVPLRVEAEGYESFSVMIVPATDQSVEIALTKTETPAKPARGKHVSKDSVKEQALESATTEGSSSGSVANLARAQQQLVYNKNKRHLKRCYDQALARGDAQEDQLLSITLKLHLTENGTVADTTVSGSGATVSTLNDCLKRETSKWNFPATAVENPVIFKFAFTTN